jgi:hypothetical protein
MVWLKTPPKNLQQWHLVYAWLPIELNDGTGRVAWLEWVWRRDISSYPAAYCEWSYKLFRENPPCF